MVVPVGLVASGLGMIVKKMGEIYNVPRDFAEVFLGAQLASPDALSAATAKSAGAFGKGGKPQTVVNLPSAEQAESMMNVDALKQGLGSIEEQQRTITKEIKDQEDAAAKLLKVEVDRQKILEETDAAFREAGLATIQELADAEVKRIMGTLDDYNKLTKVEVERTRIAEETGAAFADAGKETVAIQKALDGLKLENLTTGLVQLGQFLGGDFGAGAQTIGNITGEFDKMNKIVNDTSGEFTQAEKDSAEFEAGLSAATQAAGFLGSVLGKSTNPTVQKLGGALSGAAAGAKMGAAFGPWGAAIGAAAGAVTGFVMAGQKMIMAINDERDAFIKLHGGWEELQKSIAKASDEDLLKKLFDAKTPETYAAAMKEIDQTLKSWDESNAALQEAIDKYGFSIEELGPKFAQQQLDTQAQGLFQEFQLLKAATDDVGLVITKMGPALTEFVETSIAAGATIPEAMRPIVEELIKSGQLLDENGEAYKSTEEAGITFAQSMSEQFTTLIDKLDTWISMLLGIPKDIQTNVTVNTRRTGDDGEGSGPPGDLDNNPATPFAAGGIVTQPTLGLVGEAGPEVIMPLDKARGMGMGQDVVLAELKSIMAGQGRTISRAVRDALLQAR
jgi:hypothetical protein